MATLYLDRYCRCLMPAIHQLLFVLTRTMFVHHPRTKEFVTSIHNPNRVNFSFSFDGGDDFFRDNIRVKKDGDFMGCIGDLGWYCVRMGLLVFTGCNSEQLNEIVTAVHVVRYQLNGEGVPFDADCMVHFSQVSHLVIFSAIQQSKQNRMPVS